jgi:hypothetical protein
MINAVRLAALAYGQLWLARHLVAAMPFPWQRYSPAAKSQQQTPRQVQRGFAALIQQIGSILDFRLRGQEKSGRAMLRPLSSRS